MPDAPEPAPRGALTRLHLFGDGDIAAEALDSFGCRKQAHEAQVLRPALLQPVDGVGRGLEGRATVGRRHHDHDGRLAD